MNPIKVKNKFCAKVAVIIGAMISDSKIAARRSARRIILGPSVILFDDIEIRLQHNLATLLGIELEIAASNLTRSAEHVHFSMTTTASASASVSATTTATTGLEIAASNLAGSAHHAYFNTTITPVTITATGSDTTASNPARITLHSNMKPLKPTSN